MRDKPKAWETWESEVAQRLRVERVVASGSTDNHKGDCKGGVMLIDCKYTDGMGYRVGPSMWDKLSEWARNESRVPALAIMVENNGNAVRFVVIPEWFYCERMGVDTSELSVENEDKKTALVSRRSGGVHLFRIGHERVISMPFEKFEEMIGDEA